MHPYINVQWRRKPIMKQKKPITIIIAGPPDSGKSLLMSMLQKYFGSFEKSLGEQFKIHTVMGTNHQSRSFTPEMLKEFAGSTKLILQEHQMESKVKDSPKRVKEESAHESAYVSAMKILNYQD